MHNWSSRATNEIILHQNGRDLPGKRLSDAEAKQLIAAKAIIDKRVKDQTAAPGSEAALRKYIAGLQQGNPITIR